MLLYVDDMIISGNDAIGISELKTYLMKNFKIKDLGSLTYFLGLGISKSKEGIRAHQSKYAANLIKSARLEIL